MPRLLPVLLLLLLPMAGRIWAQVPASGGWQLEAALRGQLLQDLTQVPGQPLWLATDEGVYRYDGPGRLVPLSELRRGGVALPAGYCRSLLALPGGQLWLGTDQGAYCFGADGVLRALPLPAPGQPLRRIGLLTLAADGQHVWLRQEQAGARRYTLAGQPVGPLLPEPNLLADMWPAPDGTLWTCTMPEPRRTRHWAADGRLLGEWQHPGRDLRPVAVPGTGRVALLSARCLYWPEAGGRLRPGPAWQPEPGPETELDVVRQDTTLTVFNAGGASALRWGHHPLAAGLRRQFTVAPPPATAGVSWAAASFSAHLRLDASGRWWVYCTGVRATWTRPPAPVFVQALRRADGQPYSVRASIRLPDGRLLVSAYGSYPLVQAADSPLAALRPLATPAAQGAQRVLLGVAPAHAGPAHDQWLAASDHEFLTLNPRTGRLALLPTPGLPGTVPLPLALASDPAPGGQVWGAGSTGLYGYAPAAHAFRPYRPPGWAGPPPLAGQVLEDVQPDHQGHLWLATPAGVLRLTLATGEQVLYGPAAPAGPRRAALDGARCLWLDAAGQRLWVGSRTQGLGVVDLRTGAARQVLSTANGLPHPHVATVLPGPGGTLWLGTYAGLVRYQPATGALAVFTTADGLLSDEFNARAAYADPADPSLLLGGVAGLHRVYPARLGSLGGTRPRLLLTAFTVLATDSATAARPHYCLSADSLPTLTLAPHQPAVDLYLALSDYFEAGQARFFYRIGGWLGGRWLPLGTTPLLRLQGLPPGSYVVEVRAETAQGQPAANRLRLPLTVTAEWWQRPGTWALAAALAVLAGWAWQRRRLLRQRHDYQRRTRLAADLHDEVGALLARVTLQADLLHELPAAAVPARLAALRDDARAAATTVRDIIWSVSTEADTLGGLLVRMQEFLDQATRASGRTTALRTENLPPDPATPLPPTVRQQVYLLFKEAVTNSLRHAPAATRLDVTLRYLAPGRLALTVADDGPPAPAPSPAGQGLHNLHARAAALGQPLTAGPGPAGGWVVELGG